MKIALTTFIMWNKIVNPTLILQIILFFFQILHSISRKCSGTSLLKLKGIEVDFAKTIKKITKH